MALRINHNISALNATRHLNINNSSTAKSLEKLVSGFQINRAADDAAGLAISQKMRGQIAGLGMASQNASHGISLIQTAEGGLNEIHSILQRLNELAVQSSNGTYNDQGDRQHLDKEFQALKGELDRISQYTNYNGIKLLDGSKAYGAQAASSPGIDELLAFIQRNQAPGKLGLLVYDEQFGFSTTQTPDTNTGGLTGNITDAKYNALRNDLKTVMIPNIVNNMLAQYDCFNYLIGSSIGIGLRLYSDSSASSSDASVYVQWAYPAGSTLDQATLSLSLNVNVAKFYFNADGSINPAYKSDFEALISHEMMHAFMDIATSKGMLSPPSGADRFPLWFTEGMAQTSGGQLNWVNDTGSNSPALNGSSSDADIKKVMSNLGLTDTRSTYKTGYLAMMYLGYMAAGGGTVDAQNILNGINKLMYDIIKGKSLNKAITDNTVFSSASDFESKVKNGTAAGMCDFVRALAGILETPGAKGSLITGDLSAQDIVADTSPGLVELFQLYPNNILIKNTYPSGQVVWSGGGLNTSGVEPELGYGPSVPNPPDPPVDPPDPPVDPPDPPVYPPDPPVAPPGHGGREDSGLLLQVGANASENIRIYIGGCSITHLNLSEANVSTREEANEAIDSVKEAVNTVSSIRSELGAYHNRLEHIISNLDNTRENLTAAESTIRDADMAKEMMEFTKYNILLQSTQSMLAQANQLPQGILQLLR